MIASRATYMVASSTLLAACMALAACAGGDDDQQQMSAAADSVMMADTASAAGEVGRSLSDENVLSLLALSNGAEIAAGKAAQEKASNSDVKDFAKMLVDDHTELQKKLDSFATDANLTPVSPPMADQMQAQNEQQMDSLQSMSGAAYDRAFINDMVKDHQMTLDNLHQWESTATNAQLRSIVSGAIPVIQKHLDRAQELQSSLGSSS